MIEKALIVGLVGVQAKIKVSCNQTRMAGQIPPTERTASLQNPIAQKKTLTRIKQLKQSTRHLLFNSRPIQTVYSHLSVY